jgi:hypothetical protein
MIVIKGYNISDEVYSQIIETLQNDGLLHAVKYLNDSARPRPEQKHFTDDNLSALGLQKSKAIVDEIVELLKMANNDGDTTKI